MAIKIISDSGCNLTKELIDKYNIDIMPIFILDGEKEYLDNIDIGSEKVLEDMKNGRVYKTAQITPETFINRFKESAQKNETIIYISLSAGISGTYENAVLAKRIVESEYPHADISVVDSRAVSGGQGLMTLEAAKMAKDNIEKEKILDRINFIKKHIEHIFTIDDIEYLYRGGRVSKSQKIMGGLLSIKPILWVEDGILKPLENVRGKNKILKSMLEIIKTKKGSTDLKKQAIIIVHANNEESALKLRDMLKEEFGVEDIIINTIGSVIGAHTGPGTVGVFFLNKNS